MPEKEVRLIDANRIVEVAERAYHAWTLAMVGADDTRTINKVLKQQYLCKVVKAIAENCPTIDPESLRPHGKWIEREDYNFDTYYDCSVCGESFCLIEGVPEENFYRYCPNCGAKMDLEV